MAEQQQQQPKKMDGDDEVYPFDPIPTSSANIPGPSRLSVTRILPRESKGCVCPAVANECRELMSLFTKRIEVMLKCRPRYADAIHRALEYSVDETLMDMEGELGYMIINKDYRRPPQCRKCKNPDLSRRRIEKEEWEEAMMKEMKDEREEFDVKYMTKDMDHEKDEEGLSLNEDDNVKDEKRGGERIEEGIVRVDEGEKKEEEKDESEEEEERGYDLPQSLDYNDFM